MTRETKIGLLMGLGFIVVFAVLLLQTGPKSRPGGDLPMMLSQYGNSATSRPETVVHLSEPAVSHRPATHPADTGHETVPDALTRVSEPWNRILPTPPILDAKPDYSDLGPGGSAMTDDLTAGSHKPAGAPEITPILRVAPTTDVKPSVRPDRPTSSPPLPPSVTPPAVTPSGAPLASPAGRSPIQSDVAAPGIYVVQKGDSLVKIARKHYNNASTPVVDFLLRSNRGKVKDRHLVVDGQKLLIPVLPVNLGLIDNEVTVNPDLDRVEETGPSSPPRGSTGLRPLSSERFAPPPSALVKPGQDRPGSQSTSIVRSGPSPDLSAGPKVIDGRTPPRGVRQAVESGPIAPPVDGGRKTGDEDRLVRGNESKPSAGGKRSSPAGKSDEDAYRWYTVQPKDTLGSIATKELGGTDNWEDIAKLNKSLKPTKLKPGDKIRLPKRKPASDSAASLKRSAT